MKKSGQIYAFAALPSEKEFWYPLEMMVGDSGARLGSVT
jgi:hypothetical protein